MSLYKKLQQARVKLQKKELRKSGNNKFAGYQYFELGDFLPATQEIFDEIGLCGIVSFSAELATLQIVDTEDGTSIAFTSPMGSAALKGCHEVQNIGAVETYQRRYLWIAAMEIVEHDALDATTTKDEVQPKKKTISATDGALDMFSRKERAEIENIATHIEGKFACGEEYAAFEAYDTAKDDADYRTALWSLLGSKTRSTLKAMKAESDKQVTA